MTLFSCSVQQQIKRLLLKPLVAFSLVSHLPVGGIRSWTKESTNTPCGDRYIYCSTPGLNSRYNFA
jgi:hypothetical protein